MQFLGSSATFILDGWRLQVNPANHKKKPVAYAPGFFDS